MSAPTLLVGPGLVQFDRRDLPIYETPESRWGEACGDAAPFGVALDRLFGESDGLHVVSAMHGAVEVTAADLVSEDPLVVIAALSDGMTLPEAAQPDPIVDATGDTPPGAPLHDGWIWDLAGADWTFDFHA